MRKTDLTEFDYREIARIDAEAWRSYYNHQFFKMFWQLLRGMRAQLRFNWFLTLRLAFYSGWAATDFRLKRGKENYPRILKNLTKYYKILSAHSQEPHDYKEAARLELEWWDIHRYPKKYEKSLEASLAEAAAVLYHIEPSKLKEYAHYRAEAMLLPAHSGDKGKQDPDELYREIEAMLIKSWLSLEKAVKK